MHKEDDLEIADYLLVCADRLVACVGCWSTACGDDDDDDDDGSDSTPQSPPPTFPAGSTMAQIVAARQDHHRREVRRAALRPARPGHAARSTASTSPSARRSRRRSACEEDQIEFVEAISANRIPFLQEDKADLIISTMTINAERKKQIEFSRPYYMAGQSILVKKDNNDINDVDDLNGKNVCSVQGSTSEMNVKAKAPQAELLSLQTYSACVSAMKDGRVDAVSPTTSSSPASPPPIAR